MVGFEPTASPFRGEDSGQTELHPDKLLPFIRRLSRHSLWASAGLEPATSGASGPALCQLSYKDQEQRTSGIQTLAYLIACRDPHTASLATGRWPLFALNFGSPDWTRTSIDRSHDLTGRCITNYATGEHLLLPRPKCAAAHERPQ